MRYLIAIIGLMFVSCSKEQTPDCRQCVIIEKNLTTGVTNVYDVADCDNLIREEERFFVAGTHQYHKVVKCNRVK